MTQSENNKVILYVCAALFIIYFIKYSTAPETIRQKGFDIYYYGLIDIRKSKSTLYGVLNNDGRNKVVVSLLKGQISEQMQGEKCYRLESSSTYPEKQEYKTTYSYKLKDVLSTSQYECFEMNKESLQ